MGSVTYLLVLAITATICSAILKPNPCGFKLNGDLAKKCPAQKFCAATVIGNPRQAFCSKLPVNPSCVCIALFDPVCCAVNLGGFATITRTAGNSCECGCLRGRELFKGECHKPPRSKIFCNKALFPTCCYAPKFDLTYTAGNVCECTKQAFGVVVDRKLCGLKPLW